MSGLKLNSKDAQMTAKFQNNEEGYEQWYANNPNGFIFNNFDSNDPKYNVLHKASCSMLRRARDEGKRTRYEKWCSDSMQELIEHANQKLGNNGWSECKTCLRAN